MTTRGVLRAFLGMCVACTAFQAHAQQVTIQNGSQFVATNGSAVQAHGAGFIKVGAYYYMMGENRNPDGSFKAVSMYRSTDLKNWEYRNDILKSSSHPNLNVSNIERPKVIFNAATGKFVLWAHKENGQNYNEAQVVVATSNTIDGNYSYVAAFRPLEYESRDMTLFLDTNGAGYLISAANINADLNIYRLNASFTGVDALVSVIAGRSREAPAVIKRNGVYFLITSAATGWNPNQATYQTAPSMAGPWTNPVNFGDDRTYNSQSTFVLPLQGTSGTSYLYLGDRWAPATGQTVNESTYVWLPLTFPTNTSVAMAGSSLINLNVSAGTSSNVTSSPLFAKIKSNSSNLCVNVLDESRSYEASVAQWTCDNVPHEIVERRTIAGGYRQYVVQKSGLCLARAANGDNIVQTTCGAGLRAQWSVAGSRIVNRASGTCLNVSGNSMANGGALITYPCGNATNEQWTFVP